MGGTLDLVQRAYLGTQILDGVVHFNPTLVDELEGLSLPMQIRQVPINVTINGAELTVTALDNGASGPIRVALGDSVRELRGGESTTFSVSPRGRHALA
jgi:trehalose/maltose hydrolase-like predicted phosphorylase